MQFNCNGIKNKLTEVLAFIEKYDILIVGLQETKLTNKSKINTPNYTLVRKDRKTDKGGGVAFLVHKTLNFSEIPSPALDKHIECISI